jgi:hypothetical protein
VSQKILPKKPKVSANAVGSAKVPRQRQRKPPQTRRSVVGSARACTRGRGARANCEGGADE